MKNQNKRKHETEWIFKPYGKKPPETKAEWLSVEIVSEIGRKQDADHTALKLAEEHWVYLENLLMAHGVSDAELTKIGFHYRSAFVHGFGHGVEFAIKQR